MRFSVNVSMLFKEVPFVERFARARAAGFEAVEFWWPSGEDLVQVERAIREAGLKVAVLNFDAGNMPAGDRGLASDPARRAQFRENVPIALELASKVGCGHLNALVGLELPDLGRDEQLDLAAENVAWAADRAAPQGAVILTEALNTMENGPYLLRSTKESSDFVKRVGRKNVKVQYDVYHMQRMEGNLTATLEQYIGEIGHVQIADSPTRGEPGTGEIHFPFVLQRLDELGYRGYVGLEYKPGGGNTDESFGWLPKRARSGEVAASALSIQS